MASLEEWNQPTQVTIRGEVSIRSIDPPLTEDERVELEQSNIYPDKEIPNFRGTRTAREVLAICGKEIRGGEPGELAAILSSY